jgi:hypothetical protein
MAYSPYDTPPTANLYKRYRFPVEIISYCIVVFQFCLSYRDVE